MVQESDALAVLYTLGPPAADRPKLLIRCAWRQDSISADQLMQLLQQDGVDLNRVQCVRAMDPILHGWSLVGNTIPLVNAKQVEQPGSASPIRVLEVMVEELQFAQPAQMQMPPGSVPLIVPSNVSSFASYASYPACAPYANSSRTWEPSTPCPPLVQTPVAREPSLSERASSESLETVPSQAEAQSLGVFGQQTSFGTSSFGTSSVETTSMASHAQLLRRPREGAESLRRETMRQPHAVGDMQYVVPPHLVHNPGSFGVQLVPGSGIMHADRLELALLHAAPLVWRRGNMQVPLDHQSLSLDFKGEVKALLDVLGRVNKQIGVRFDVAASATLVEVLALKPMMLHLVCHGDIDENSLQAATDSEMAQNPDAFFLGFEDNEGALDQLSLERLRRLLNPPDLVRSTQLVFVSACHSQPAAEVFAAAGVPHVVAVRADAKVLDDAAALFARHLYLALVQGYTVRAAFELGQAALASAAPSIRLPKPAEEAHKFLLLPLPPGVTGAERGESAVFADGCDPHDVVIFERLPPGTVVTRNPLPQHEPPYLTKPFLGRAIELQRLVLMLGRRRQKEVRLVTLCGPKGVGKTCLAIAAAVHLYERRWFREGCVYVELRGRSTEQEALLALTEALDMELCSLNDIGRALKHWRGLLVLDGCDDAQDALMPRLLSKLLSTQDLRVLCTARTPVGVATERLFEVKPLQPLDAARLFRELAMESLPVQLRALQTLMEHAVLKALRGLPRAILQTAPLLRQGKTMQDLEEDLRERDAPAPAAAPALPAAPAAAPKPTAEDEESAPAPPVTDSAEETSTAGVAVDDSVPDFETKLPADAEAATVLVPTGGAELLPVTSQNSATESGVSPRLSKPPSFLRSPSFTALETETLQKSLRRSLEVSLEFVRHSNEAAYALLGVMSLLPGGAVASDLCAIWDQGSLIGEMRRLCGGGNNDRLSTSSAVSTERISTASVDGAGADADATDAGKSDGANNANNANSSSGDVTVAGATEWEPLMQLLVQPPLGTEGQWLVRQKRLGLSSQEHFVSELVQQQVGLPTMVLRELARRCALHFGKLGEAIVSTLENGSGDECARATELFNDSLEANMWGCLAHERLRLLRCSSATAVRATANVGNALSRILSLLGRCKEAASAAQGTIDACEELDIGSSEAAAVAHSLLGDHKLKLGQHTEAQEALQRAVETWSASGKTNDKPYFDDTTAPERPTKSVVQLRRSRSSNASRLRASFSEMSSGGSNASVGNRPPRSKSYAQIVPPDEAETGDGKGAHAPDSVKQRLIYANLKSEGLLPNGKRASNGSILGKGLQRAASVGLGAGRSGADPAAAACCDNRKSDEASTAGDQSQNAHRRPASMSEGGAKDVVQLEGHAGGGGGSGASGSSGVIGSGCGGDVCAGSGASCTDAESAAATEEQHARERGRRSNAASEALAEALAGDDGGEGNLVAPDPPTMPQERSEQQSSADDPSARDIDSSEHLSSSRLNSFADAGSLAAATEAATHLSTSRAPNQLDDALQQISSTAAVVGLSEEPSQRRWLIGLVHALLTLGESHLACARKQGLSPDESRVAAAADELLRAENHFREAQLRLPHELQPDASNDKSDANRAGAGGGNSGGGEAEVGAGIEEEMARLRQHTTAGLAEVALRRGEPQRAVNLLTSPHVKSDAAMDLLRGEALVQLGDLEQARATLQTAVAKWREAGNGVRAQEAVDALERVRVLLVSQRLDTSRLVVLHAAPLVMAEPPPARPSPPSPPPTAAPTCAKMQPVAFSKRVGIRAWRALLDSLRRLQLALKVQLEAATVESITNAIYADDQPMLHFLPAVEWGQGIALEGTAGELEVLPAERLRQILEAAKPRLPSLVFICARRSEQVAQTFVEAGVPVVVALRGFLPERAVFAFSEHFYDSLLKGAKPRAAFEIARERQRADSAVPAAGEFVLYSALDINPIPVLPPAGQLQDVSPKQCQCNLPYINSDTPATEGEAGGDKGSGGSSEEDETRLAHGTGFVGRHLEIHKLITSCLTNQLTTVTAVRGHGKSALVLEVARYLRQRHRFPHGIFCCSLEGLRSMKQVVRTIGHTLNVPAGSARELCELMTHYRCCLLILDRCEAAIQQSKPQFIWFLDQLLSNSCVKVVLLTSSPLTEFPPHDSPITAGTITLKAMLPTDAALLLLEICEREIDPVAELGAPHGSELLQTLANHELIRRLDGVPVAVRWAARRLAEKTVPELLDELRPLAPHEQARMVMQSSPGAELRPSRSASESVLMPPMLTHSRSVSSGRQRSSRRLQSFSQEAPVENKRGHSANNGDAALPASADPLAFLQGRARHFHHGHQSAHAGGGASGASGAGTSVGGSTGSNLSRVRHALRSLVESATEVGEAAAAAAGQAGSEVVEGEIQGVLGRLTNAFATPRRDARGMVVHGAQYAGGACGAQYALPHGQHARRGGGGHYARDVVREVLRDRERSTSRSRKLYALEQQPYVMEDRLPDAGNSTSFALLDDT